MPSAKHASPPPKLPANHRYHLKNEGGKGKSPALGPMHTANPGGSPRLDAYIGTHVTGADKPALPELTGLPAEDAPTPQIKGIEAIRDAWKRLPARPGVYRMLGADGEVLYVGKAKSLKNRVGQYAQGRGHTNAIYRMIHQTVSMEVIVTATETEALLLETNMIKRLKPRYNIVLRDDKSYPWLMLTEDHAYPQIAKHRGARVRKGSYYGPFASAWSVNQTVTAMQDRKSVV